MNPTHATGPGWRTMTGGGVAAVGIGAAIAGVVLRNSGQKDWQNVLDSANGAPFEYGRTHEVVEAYRTANSKMQFGTAGILGGTALAVAGAGLFVWDLLDGPKQQPDPTSQKVACGVSASGMRCSFSFP
jgi:hypothetical protein